MTSTALATRSTMGDKLEYAKTLAESGLLPKQYQRQPANVLYAVEYGESLGLAPMAAITGVHVIEGKPTASSGLIGALVRNAGHRLRITGDDNEATAEIVRNDDPDFTFRATWTMERARQANITGKAVWKSYPAAMLKARAITEVARDACEEVLFGLHYTAEELGADVDANGNTVTATAERVEVPTQQARPTPEPIDWDAKINACTTAAELREVYTLARGMEPNSTELHERIAAAGARAAADEAEAAEQAKQEQADGEPAEQTAIDDAIEGELVEDSRENAEEAHQ